MFKQFINYVVGADFYMVTSFMIFFIFFIVMGIMVYRTDNKKLKRISELPLND